MDEYLRKKIIEDLKKSGLASEIRAARILDSLGWRVKLGSGYYDLDEEKTREIDISAYHSSNIKEGKITAAYIFFHLTAEVKKSEKPWIVFKRKLERYEKGCAWNNLTTYINLPDRPVKFTSALQQFSLLRKVGWEGTGIHQSFKNPSSPSAWYSAFTSACKAAEDDAENSKSEGDQFTDNLVSNPLEFNFYQPIVILDGTLLSAELDDFGELVVEEVDYAPFRFDFKTANYRSGTYRVDLVTLSSLEEYAKDVLNRQALFRQSIEKYVSA